MARKGTFVLSNWKKSCWNNILSCFKPFFFRYSQKDDYCYDYILLFTLTKSHHLQGVTHRPELQ